MGEGNGNGLLGYSTVLAIADPQPYYRKQKKIPLLYLLNNSLSLQENLKPSWSDSQCYCFLKEVDIRKFCNPVSQDITCK